MPRYSKSAERLALEALEVGATCLIDRWGNTTASGRRVRALTEKLRPARYVTRTTTKGIRVWRIE